MLSGTRLRELAEHVNINVLRKIGNHEEIVRRFAELRGFLLAWADKVGPLATEGEAMPTWQNMSGKEIRIGSKFNRELTIDMKDNVTGQRLQYVVAESPDEFAAHKDEIRKVAHEKLDLLLDKMFG